MDKLSDSINFIVIYRRDFNQTAYKKVNPFPHDRDKENKRH